MTPTSQNLNTKIMLDYSYLWWKNNLLIDWVEIIIVVFVGVIIIVLAPEAVSRISGFGFHFSKTIPS